MPRDYSINISDFTGIFHAMAEKANVNGGNTLDAVEINIFSEIESTLDKENKTFIFENKFYDASGKETTPFYRLPSEKNVSTRIAKVKDEKTTSIEERNNTAVQNAKDFAREMAENSRKTITVNKEINGKMVNFSYNRDSIEKYIIYDSVDPNNNKIKYFSDIPKIKNKPFAIRTEKENKKLLEFNNMVNTVINAGVEYGVDPKLIVSIIQKEVCYNGLDKSVISSNGRGYMQITKSPIRDIIGGNYIKKLKKVVYSNHLKTIEYGPEAETLLKSRGFNVNCPAEEKEQLLNDIVKYLESNVDIDFNIRLGTLILRKYYYDNKGNIRLTAQRYNNHKLYKKTYGRAVDNNYNKLCELEKMA